MSVSRCLQSILHTGLSAVLAALIALPCMLPVFAEETSPEEVMSMEDELSVDPTGKSDGYSAVLYDNTNGLPTGEANTVLQTSDGFLWIGCYSGLIRYDGCHFDRIDSTTGIASVVSLYEDSRHRLWVGTNDGGAAVMEHNQWRMYNKQNGLMSLSVRSICEGENGYIFLGTTQGLYVVRPNGSLAAIDDERLKDAYIRHLQSGENGVIYGFTMNGDVFTISGNELDAFYSAEELGISDIHALMPDPEHPGYVYIGDKGSDLYYGRLQKQFRPEKTYDISPLGYTNAMQIVGDMLWICTDNGIGFLEDGQMYPIENVPMNTSVEAMTIDYQRNLWFASSKQGVMKIVPNQFTDIFEKYHLENEVVESTCVHAGKLLIGTKTSGLIALRHGSRVSKMAVRTSVDADGKTFSDNDLLTMLDGKRIRCLLSDSQERLWVATFGELGLVCYDHGKVTRFTNENGMPSDRVRAVYETRDGRIYAACTGGLVAIEDGKIGRIWNEADGIENTEILTVSETFDGDVILGTDGGGMYIIHDDTLTHYGTEEGLGSDVVMRIKPDVSRDVLWIVTSNSIAYMNADHSIHTIRKFPYSNNFDLYENSRSEVWVLSSNGIYVCKAEELLANEEISPIYYGTDNGLPCMATSNSYSALTDDGDLYIAGTTGVAKVNIEMPVESVNDVLVSVPFVEADGRYIFPKPDGSFYLPSSVKKLTVYSYVFNYSLINPEVTCCLEGFEAPTTMRRSDLTPLSYTNLRGGEYKFHLEIKDAQGQTTKSLSVPITKEKAFFELWWVHLTCLIVILSLAGLAVMLYVDYRTQKFRRREAQQKQFIREMVEAFAKVIDMKDSYTNGHSSRVAEYTVELCKELGLDEDTIERYYCIAMLHDIGKIGIPPEVLNKPGKLTNTEFNIIKSHSALGYQTLKDISIMPELAVGAGCHHERPDGKGYPRGLKGDDIPRVAQIIAVADTFDAMYSDRPYRKRMNFDKVVSIMKEVRGTQLAEDVVDAFLRLVDKGKFRAPDDHGGGTTEDIDNIHRKQQKQAEQTKSAQSEKNT